MSNWPWNERKLPSCKDCPRYHERLVPPRIVPDSPYLIVGEAPGRTEVGYTTADGTPDPQPFVGGAGRVLAGALTAAGLSRESCSMTNACLCYVDGNTTPTPEELEHCAPMLAATIAECDPQVLIAVGSIATARLVGNRPITQWRGSIITPPTAVKLGRTRVYGPDVYGPKAKKAGQPKPHWRDIVIEQKVTQPVVLTLHPAEVMRSGMVNRPLLIADLRRARYLHENRTITVGNDINTNVRPEDAANMLARHDTVALDYETDRESGELKIVGLACDKDTAITLEPSPELAEILRRAFTEPERLVIAHNASFEYKVSKDNGFPLECRLWDTMHAVHYLRPDLNKGLQETASRVPEFDYYAWKSAWNSGMHYDWHLYNAYDCAYTYALYDVLRASLTKTKQLRAFENVIMPLVPYIAELELTGVNVDTDVYRELYTQQQRLIASLEQQWNELTDSCNWRSPQQTQALFYGKLGMKVQKDAKTKSPTLSRTALDTLHELYPNVQELQLLSKLRHATKIMASYLEQVQVADGASSVRLYPQYNLSGTETGRLSGGGSRGFNFQNIPRSGDDCPLGMEDCACNRVRELFVADDGDLGLAVADWSQVEYRVQALLAGDTRLLKAFEDPNFDIHADTAAGLNVSRQLGKRINFAVSYLMGAKKLAKTAGCTLAEARDFLERFRALRPEITRYRERMIRLANQTGRTVNPFGRVNYYVRDKAGKVRPSDVVAFFPQSTAADMLLRALLAAFRAGLKVRWTVHDEIGISVRKKEDVDTLRECMSIPFDELGGWSCPADISVGTSWADAKD